MATTESAHVTRNGRIEVAPTVALNDRDDLAHAYTPGVADDVREIASDPGRVGDLTARENTILVITDGSAILGVGDEGPLAALPVMEGKAALLRAFADVYAWPICLRSRDIDDVVRTIVDISPGVAGINLEDVAAPRCFDIVTRLRDALDMPVFHDDQHGTAVIVLAALRNALRQVGKSLDRLTVVVSGAGAAGSSVTRLLLHEGVPEVIVCDSLGALHTGRSLYGEKRWLAENTNTSARTGTLAESLDGADALIGLSAPGILDADSLEAMSNDAIVFGLANPEPEMDPEAAREHAAVVATGRSDDPNQINNALVFPGVFRGLLDSDVRRVDEALLARTADAIAGLASGDSIVPDIFDGRLVPAIADAVRG